MLRKISKLPLFVASRLPWLPGPNTESPSLVLGRQLVCSAGGCLLGWTPQG